MELGTMADRSGRVASRGHMRRLNPGRNLVDSMPANWAWSVTVVPIGTGRQLAGRLSPRFKNLQNHALFVKKYLKLITRR
jgi:hypothetical protein